MTMMWCSFKPQHDINVTPAHLKCPYGFSRNDFSRKFDQWQIRRKKFSDSDLSFASNSLLKQALSVHGRANRSPGTNDVKGGMKVA